MVRLKGNKVNAIANFLDDLGLVPSILITKEVVDLIYKSWQREFQRDDLDKQKKQAMQDMILKLSQRKRRPTPILDDQLPINFNPLYDDVHTTYNETDSF